jgi:iron complex outermembrane recepter protein
MVEFQHTLAMDRHNIVWGADYTQDRFSTDADSTKPNSFKNDQFSAFIQDEITLRDDLWLTLGYRSQWNEVSHSDWAGNMALVHEVRAGHFLRASVSRAFRRPYMFESFAFRANGKFTGNDDLLNEEMISYELGYRGQVTEKLEVNVEFFLNEYKDLIGTQTIAPTTSHYNSHDLRTYGVETSLAWHLKEWWLLRASHSFEYMEDEGSINDKSEGVGRLGIWTMPRHKASLTNRFYLNDDITLNTQLFWSDKFRDRSPVPNDVPSYFRLDMHVTWEIWNDQAEISFGVTNLNDRSHYEGSQNLSEVPRIVYGQFQYHF